MSLHTGIQQDVAQLQSALLAALEEVNGVRDEMRIENGKLQAEFRDAVEVIIEWKQHGHEGEHSSNALAAADKKEIASRLDYLEISVEQLKGKRDSSSTVETLMSQARDFLSKTEKTVSELTYKVEQSDQKTIAALEASRREREAWLESKLVAERRAHEKEVAVLKMQLEQQKLEFQSFQTGLVGQVQSLMSAARKEQQEQIDSLREEIDQRGAKSVAEAKKVAAKEGAHLMEVFEANFEQMAKDFSKNQTALVKSVDKKLEETEFVTMSDLNTVVAKIGGDIALVKEGVAANTTVAQFLEKRADSLEEQLSQLDAAEADSAEKVKSIINEVKGMSEKIAGIQQMHTNDMNKNNKRCQVIEEHSSALHDSINQRFASSKKELTEEITRVAEKSRTADEALLTQLSAEGRKLDAIEATVGGMRRELTAERAKWDQHSHFVEEQLSQGHQMRQLSASPRESDERALEKIEHFVNDFTSTEVDKIRQEVIVQIKREMNLQSALSDPMLTKKVEAMADDIQRMKGMHQAHQIAVDRAEGSVLRVKERVEAELEGRFARMEQLQKTAIAKQEQLAAAEKTNVRVYVSTEVDQLHKTLQLELEREMKKQRGELEASLRSEADKNGQAAAQRLDEFAASLKGQGARQGKALEEALAQIRLEANRGAGSDNISRGEKGQMDELRGQCTRMSEEIRWLKEQARGAAARDGRDLDSTAQMLRQQMQDEIARVTRIGEELQIRNRVLIEEEVGRVMQTTGTATQRLVNELVVKTDRELKLNQEEIASLRQSLGALAAPSISINAVDKRVDVLRNDLADMMNAITRVRNLEEKMRNALADGIRISSEDLQASIMREIGMQMSRFDKTLTEFGKEQAVTSTDMMSLAGKVEHCLALVRGHFGAVNTPATSSMSWANAKPSYQQYSNTPVSTSHLTPGAADSAVGRSASRAAVAAVGSLHPEAAGQGSSSSFLAARTPPPRSFRLGGSADLLHNDGAIAASRSGMVRGPYAAPQEDVLGDAFQSAFGSP